MISCLLAVCVLTQDGQGAQKQEQTVSPAALVSKMLAHYAGATSMVGTITMTQTTGNLTSKIVTRLQFEAPDKIFVDQVQQGKNNRWIISTDGKFFSYSPPANVMTKKPGEPLIEPVLVRGRKQTYRDIFGVGYDSLIDQNAPLAIAFGRRENLQYLKNQWVNVQFQGGEDKIGDVKVNWVYGKWRLNPTMPATGTYAMAITDDGELKQFYHEEPVRINVRYDQQDFLIKTVWDVDLKVNAKPDPAMFQLIK